MPFAASPPSFGPACSIIFGLVAAVEWQAQDFEKLTGLAVRLSVNSTSAAVEGATATTVFRMLQETLTNVARHATATRVDIALDIGADAVTSAVADNGRGISDAELTDRRSLGLVGLRERAIACGGELVIEGRPGHGTVYPPEFRRAPRRWRWRGDRLFIADDHRWSGRLRGIIEGEPGFRGRRRGCQRARSARDDRADAGLRCCCSTSRCPARASSRCCAI